MNSLGSNEILLGLAANISLSSGVAGASGGGIDHHGGRPAGGGYACGCGLLVPTVQLHLLPGVEDKESAGVGQQQSVAV